MNRVFILASILGYSYVKSKEVSRKRQTCWAEDVLMSEYGLGQLHHKSVMVISVCNMPGTFC